MKRIMLQVDMTNCPDLNEWIEKWAKQQNIGNKSTITRCLLGSLRRIVLAHSGQPSNPLKYIETAAEDVHESLPLISRLKKWW